MPLGGGVPAALGSLSGRKGIRGGEEGRRWRWRRGIGLYERAVRWMARLQVGPAPSREIGSRKWDKPMEPPNPLSSPKPPDEGKGERWWKYAMLSSIVAVISRCIYPISSFSRPTAAAAAAAAAAFVVVVVARFLVSPSRSRTTLSPKLWDWSGVDALSGRNVADGHDRLFHFR